MEKFGLTFLMLSEQLKSSFGELTTSLAPLSFEQCRESQAHRSLPCDCRRRDGAMKWLLTANPSANGGLGKSAVLSAIPRSFRDARRPLVKIQKTPKKQARNKVKSQHNDQSPATGNRHYACCLKFLSMRLLLL